MHPSASRLTRRPLRPTLTCSIARRYAPAVRGVDGPCFVDGPRADARPPPAVHLLVAGRPVGLAAKEYALLVHLSGDPTRVFTKAELLRDVWGYRALSRSRTLDCHAVRLRSKLRAAGEAPWLETVWGVGYRLAPAGLLAGERSAA